MKSKEIEIKDKLTFEEIAILEKATGGKIDTYQWWEVKGNDGPFRSYIKPKNENDIIFHGELNNSFLSQKGEYVGDIERAKWYQKHKLKIYEPYPHGVAEAYDNNNELYGYCGYTHRGACIFKIGDRLFDSTYEPKKEDYILEQWEAWEEEYNKGIAEAEEEGNNWWADDIRKDGIGRYIPFRLKGSKIIETFEEALQAAKNLSSYLS